MEHLSEVETLSIGECERLDPKQAIGEAQPDVERPASAAFLVDRHSPFAVGDAATVARQRGDVVRDHVDRRHATQGTVRAMRAVVQRVSSASVSVDGEVVASIGRGLLVLLGVRDGDGEAEADKVAAKLEALRIFEDGDGKMNLSVREAGGELLVVSNFTVYGDTRKGNRPSFVEAARPEMAEPLVERIRAALGAQGGRFGARMAVELVNDGPVTVLIDA